MLDLSLGCKKNIRMKRKLLRNCIQVTLHTQFSLFFPDRPLSNRYRGSSSHSELLAAGPDSRHRRGVLRSSDILSVLFPQHQAARGCE